LLGFTIVAYISLALSLNNFIVLSFDYNQDGRGKRNRDGGSDLMKQLKALMHGMMSFSFCRFLLRRSIKSRAGKNIEILLRIHSF